VEAFLSHRELKSELGMKKDLRGTWPQALLSFFGPVLLVLCVRWLLFEPFVIPSGSMIPSLLIHDHIFVNKLAFGVHVPFKNQFLVQWGHPKHGDVVVFRFPDNPEVFYVKRVIAVGGEEISIQKGQITINGAAYPQEKVTLAEEDPDFQYEKETSDHAYTIRHRNKDLSEFAKTQVPAGHFFVMGDNRDQSNDSRFWGFVPEENLIGTAERIWLSCDRTLASAQFLCDPQAIRWQRFLKKVE
jgi:signal peptidase I